MARVEFSLTDIADGTVHLSATCIDDAGQQCDMFPDDMSTATAAQKAFARMYVALRETTSTRPRVPN